MTTNTWTPLMKCSEIVSHNEASAAAWAKMSQAERDALTKESTWWKNDVYTVCLRKIGPDGAGGDLFHVSIRRNDRTAAKDWRDFQKIKNQLCGREAEGLELYPAESRVVDTANQYHLWVATKYRLKIGWQKGVRMTAAEAAASGSVQREDI